LWNDGTFFLDESDQDRLKVSFSLPHQPSQVPTLRSTQLPTHNHFANKQTSATTPVKSGVLRLRYEPRACLETRFSKCLSDG
jgi:hypothetical protein